MRIKPAFLVLIVGISASTPFSGRAFGSVGNPGSIPEAECVPTSEAQCGPTGGDGPIGTIPTGGSGPTSPGGGGGGAPPGGVGDAPPSDGEADPVSAHRASDLGAARAGGGGTDENRAVLGDLLSRGLGEVGSWMSGKSAWVLALEFATAIGGLAGILFLIDRWRRRGQS